MRHNTFSGSFIGQNVITLESTSSTNDYLRERLAKSTPFPEGTVIMAVHQFAGKGQRGAVWESEPGTNLTCSVLLKPSFMDPIDQFALTITVSLALMDFLSLFIANHQIAIKWPNDIYIGQRKVSGILIENVVQGKSWKYAVVGIGININQLVFPEQFRDRVTSLHLLTGKTLDPGTLLPALCTALERRYTALRRGEIHQQAAAYRQKLFRLGEEGDFLVDGKLIRGTILGVGPQGRLEVDIEGQAADFGIREISFVP